MITRIRNRLFRFVQALVHSIAFLPALISLAFLVFCFATMLFEYTEPVITLKQKWPLLFVEGADNARTILGSLVGGLISLTVFSFSMVMVVLTRASATLTPRVIPGLVTQRHNQVTLGVYIGSIIYCLLLTVNIRAGHDEIQVPGLGIIFAILFGILSLGLFVSFIHSISRSIQVDFVLQDIFRKTRQEITDRLNQLDESDEGPLPDSEDWHEVSNKHTGYFKKCNIASLMEILKKNDLRVVTRVHRGEFVAKGRPLLVVDNKVDDDTRSALLDCFTFYVEEFAGDHYSFGFNQISEIAIKALSPGINDPGTAIRALNLLSMLFADLARHPGFNVEKDDDGKSRLFYTEQSFEKMLYLTIGPIREYGKHDAIVVGKIIESCMNIAYSDLADDRKQKVADFINDLVEEVGPDIVSAMDRQHVDRELKMLNNALVESSRLELLEDRG